MGYRDRIPEVNCLIAEYMGYDKKTNEEYYKLEGRQIEDIERTFLMLPGIRNQINYKVGWDWYNPAGLRFHNSWDWLVPVMKEIYARTGYAFTVNSRKAWIQHDDVYARKVLGNKILNYYHDSCSYTTPDEAIKSVWELVAKFVEKFKNDELPQVTGHK